MNEKWDVPSFQTKEVFKDSNNKSKYISTTSWRFRMPYIFCGFSKLRDKTVALIAYVKRKKEKKKEKVGN